MIPIQCSNCQKTKILTNEKMVKEFGSIEIAREKFLCRKCKKGSGSTDDFLKKKGILKEQEEVVVPDEVF